MSDFDSEQGGSAPEDAAPQAAPESSNDSGGNDAETRQWSMFLHFSILAGFIIPFAGLIAPILIWQLKKDDLPGIVPHAHIVMNWIITGLVYWVISFILIFALGLGILLMAALGIATVVFSIIGGIKANDGEVWEYPMTMIKAFK